MIAYQVVNKPWGLVHVVFKRWRFVRVDINQHIAWHNGFSRNTPNSRNCAAHGGNHRKLHFHCLNDDKLFSGFDLLALLRQKFPDVSVKICADTMPRVFFLLRDAGLDECQFLFDTGLFPALYFRVICLLLMRLEVGNALRIGIKKLDVLSKIKLRFLNPNLRSPLTKGLTELVQFILSTD
ncbi:hypothetical protein AYR47_20455 [Pseudomonas azotoformans]|uniref:Uncharacterized protein n=1 Tax=Pseudomonas azotoformans TaxID=47878 RepID=A0A127I1A5_PSEAZ|nr:hypothetical protein AYR47_20455 [Pseudomonas azotoformans]